MAYKDLNVCIDARLADGACGGVQQVVIGMASGLSGLPVGRERYFFLTHSGDNAWLKPYVSGACNILEFDRHAIPFRDVAIGGAVLRLPNLDSVFKEVGCRVVHFTFQAAFVTEAVPSIFHPHDLQHLHLPEFFSEQERAYRELTYRLFCYRAGMVACSSRWVRDDLVQQYRLPQEKIAVIPWAPVLDSYPAPTPKDLDAVKSKFNLPAAFAYYPAQTWPHKNHAGLFHALAWLRHEKGVIVPFVSSGKKNAAYQSLASLAQSLGIMDQITFLDFVSPMELQCLYRLARCVIIPSLFEAASFPMWEAFHAGVPVACSNVTSLPEQAGDAAVIFDPRNPVALGTALLQVWKNERLRGVLARSGKERLKELSWDRTVKVFRAHYRRLAKDRLSEEDVLLIRAKSPL